MKCDEIIKRSKILILEKTKSGLLNLILFYNNKWNKYVTIGGRVEKYETFENTIKREIIEETSNTIHIDELIDADKLKYIDVYNYDKLKIELFRIYFLILDLNLPNNKSFDIIYNNNRQIVSNQNLSYDWHEMGDVTRIPFDNLILNNFTNVDGNKIKIFNQVIKYVKCGQNIINKISDTLVNYTIIKNSSNSSLFNTESIKLIF
jgi:8-oxo-dGTP pyrophosphatase MutT (NUDIX family)